MAWKIRLSGEASNALEQTHTRMAGDQARAVKIAGRDWSVHPSRNVGRYTIERGEVRGVYDASAADGWTLELIARSTWLATSPLHEVIRELTEIAETWGEVSGTRLRRFDMAADFAGWRIYAHDPLRLVKTRCRTAKVVSFAEAAKAAKRAAARESGRTYRAGVQHITGHVVAPGNPVMLRIYDKVAELKVMQNKAKRETEMGVWSDNGWTGTEGVTRVEFQLRGPVLDELRLRDPARLAEGLQPTWNALVGVGTATKASDKRSGWIRLQGKTRPIDPRWKKLRELDWSGPAAVAERIRLRNAVPCRAMLGNVLSYLGGRDAFPEFLPIDTAELDAAPRREREAAIRDVLERVSEAMKEAAIRELLEDLNGASYAVERPLEVAARFAEGKDDGETDQSVEGSERPCARPLVLVPWVDPEHGAAIEQGHDPDSDVVPSAPSSDGQGVPDVCERPRETTGAPGVVEVFGGWYLAHEVERPTRTGETELVWVGPRAAGRGAFEVHTLRDVAKYGRGYHNEKAARQAIERDNIKVDT